MAPETTVPRIDPDPRPIDGDVGGRIVNARPDRVYVWANPNDPDTGLQHMLEMGFEIEKVSSAKDAVRIEGGYGSSESGGNITRRGQILVSCSKTLADRLQAQKNAWADRVEQSIRPGTVEQRIDRHMVIKTTTDISRS